MGLKQSDIAGRSGKSQSKVSQLENGEADPRLSTLIAMAEAMNAEVKIVPRRQVGTTSFLKTVTDYIQSQREQGTIDFDFPLYLPNKMSSTWQGGGEPETVYRTLKRFQTSGGAQNAAFNDVFIPDPQADENEESR